MKKPLPRKIKYLVPVFFFLILVVVVLSRSGVEELNVVYPFDGTLFPCDIAAPTLVWEDMSGAESWNVTLGFQDKGEQISVETSEKTWTPDRELWETIKKRSLEKTAVCTIKGLSLIHI